MTLSIVSLRIMNNLQNVSCRILVWKVPCMQHGIKVQNYFNYFARYMYVVHAIGLRHMHNPQTL